MYGNFVTFERISFSQTMTAFLLEEHLHMTGFSNVVTNVSILHHNIKVLLILHLFNAKPECE